MNPSRHSVANALRLAKGTLNATLRAQIRHGRSPKATERLERALRSLRVAMAEMREARDVVAPRSYVSARPKPLVPETEH